MLCCGVLCLLAMLPLASQAEFDPRAHGDLNGVIMLCATEPGSARFNRAWRDWVAGNPQADLDAAIATVVSRAGTVRSMAVPGMEPKQPGGRPTSKAIAEHMRALVR